MRFGRLHSFSPWLSMLAIPLLIWPGLVRASGDFDAPTPSMIEQLRQQHAAKDWLRVTTATNRLELRVEEFANDGLHGLRARKRTSLPSMLPWSSIQRIDRRASRFRTGQLLGFAVGAIAGGFIGAEVAEQRHSTGTGPTLTGMAVGGVTGAWLGGRIGDRIVREQPLYIASPSPPSELMDSTSAEIVVTTPVPAEAWATQVRAQVKPGELLRLTGNFGEFSGHVTGIEAQGLSGLQPDPAFESTVPLPSEPLSWTEISRVERRGHSTNRYALYGGLALGVTTGVMAAGIASGLTVPSATFGQLVGAFTVGFLIGGGIGTGAGAVIGSWVPRWHRVYP